jgi:two-component system, cell cycle sensor histidine kinase and response regulator CckA
MQSEQLRDSRKLQTMGRLSEAVAHDVNNLLSGILGYSELLLDENTADHLKPLIEEIAKSGKRIAALIRLLLVFRKSDYSPEKLDLNQLINNLEKYLHHIIGSQITFDVSLQPELWPVRSDPSYIKRLLLSIAADMQEIIPKDGQFAVETRNVTVPDHSMAAVPIDSGRYVRITAGTSVQISFPGLLSPGKTLLGNSEISGIVRLCGGQMFDVVQSGEDFALQIYLPAAE